MTTILITGSNGFIGASFARRARARGWQVAGLDLQPGDAGGHCDTYVGADLAAPDALQRLRELPAPDLILHAGGISGFMVETDNPARIVAVNVAGTMPIIERALQCKSKLVLCSTIMTYGPDRVPGALRHESEYPEPISIYGASKVALEALMHGFRGQYGLDAVALRFGHVYGPGRTTQCFVRDMLTAASARRPCHIPQARASLRQYIHIEDVCHAIDLAMAADSLASRVFNITADEIHTLEDVAAEVGRQAGGLAVSFDDSCDLANYRVGKLSGDRATAELGYRPEFPLAAGIRSYWNAAFSAPTASPQ
jgi:UDP-glucuronate 4-epimerase